MPFQNELVTLASVFAFFGGLVAFFRLFGKAGIFAWTVTSKSSSSSTPSAWRPLSATSSSPRPSSRLT